MSVKLRHFEKMAVEFKKGNVSTFCEEHTIGLKLKKERHFHFDPIFSNNKSLVVRNFFLHDFYTVSIFPTTTVSMVTCKLKQISLIGV